MSYATWFRSITGFEAHPWQLEVAEPVSCVDRVLRIPTGFGKTAGTVLPWLEHRVVRRDLGWPTRLVYVLPMRVLVEQTEAAIRGWLEKAGLASEVDVVVLMGGVEQARWVERPERPQIIVGTQDMILSRALLRGFGSGRALWPMEYGLIHEDVLWVCDEVQLMDVGLATTTQLRALLASRPLAMRPRHIWWMSATLQDAWLATVDHAPMLAAHPLPKTTVPATARSGGLWDVRKQLERRPDIADPKELAALVKEGHRGGALSLVVVNTVRRAIEVFRLLQKALAKSEVDLRLVHSRFRGHERRAWRTFLARNAERPTGGRIVIATQVVEAGVDISAELLVSDLAPWPSLVQRFGRCARYGGESGRVVVVGPVPPDDTKAAPYMRETLLRADEALAIAATEGADVGPANLERLEDSWAEHEEDLLAGLYPYAPLHVLRRADFADLFDTAPDLSGADLDVSRYIRTVEEERDVSVFFRRLELPANAPRKLDEVVPPGRDELCRVPVFDLDPKKRPIYVRDFVDGGWRKVDRLAPGMTVLLDAGGGGYSVDLGWDGRATEAIPEVPQPADSDGLAEASAAFESDQLSQAPWKTIATHGREAADEALRIANTLGLDERMKKLLQLAARWHDVGKHHDVFQDAIRPEARSQGGGLAARRDLAKAPSDAWRRPPYPRRPGFRHELASVLALYETLRRAAPGHDALLGGVQDVFEALGEMPVPVQGEEGLADHPLARELAGLEAEDIDLVAWLIATHHGKLRVGWASTPLDQEADHGGIAGVCDGDALTHVEVIDGAGGRHALPVIELSLELAALGLGARFGRSWTDRVGGLLQSVGPTGLAFLEAILRAADWRASRLPTEDTL